LASKNTNPLASIEGFSLLTNPFYILASCFLTWRVKMLVYSPVWRVGLKNLFTSVAVSMTALKASFKQSAKIRTI
jgi:hypothetical protein